MHGNPFAMADTKSSSASTGNGDAATIMGGTPDPMHYSRGYQKLSCLMGKLPEFALYRRFGRLNALNLLYL